MNQIEDRYGAALERTAKRERAMAHGLDRDSTTTEAARLAGKRIVFVQAGNYAEAFKRFATGGDENFYAQRYSVEFVAELARRDEVEHIVQICLTENLVPETLPGGIQQLGLDYWPSGKPARTDELIALVRAQRPTHVISNSPITPLIRAMRKAGVEVLPLLADSFGVGGIKAKIRYAWLAHNLKHPRVRWVSNHNLKASEDLERIGVPGSKIVPFDWPPVVSPDDFVAKTSAAQSEAARLLYVGQVKVAKGVGDLIDAVALGHQSGKPYHLTIVGAGDIEPFGRYAAEKNVTSRVTFAGKMAHRDVMAAMHESDIVLVPSHHEYPEGLPMTIYEGLCSRTPLIVSDHPMFSTRVKDGRDCLVFPARDVPALKRAIDKLLGDPSLYATLSKNAAEACANFLVGAPWGDLIEHWLSGAPADEAWLAERALTSARFR